MILSSQKYYIGNQEVNKMFLQNSEVFSSSVISVPTSELLVRFNADLGITESGGSIISWTDQQNAVVATAFNGPTLLTNEFNGRRAVSFDGVNDYFTFLSTLLNTQSRTILIIGKYTNPTGRPQNGMLNSLTPSQDNAYVFHNGSTADAYFYTGSSQFGPKSFTSNAYMIQTIVHRTNGTGFIRINGVQGGGTSANSTQTINIQTVLRETTNQTVQKLSKYKSTEKHYYT
jgi:hypothetical protein